jgi:hypothetical protein
MGPVTVSAVAPVYSNTGPDGTQKQHCFPFADDTPTIIHLADPENIPNTPELVSA